MDAASEARPSGVRASEPGILITRVRGYNMGAALFFGGRRGAVNRALVTASGTGPGDRVLDVGSGPGRFAAALADAVGADGEVVGVDPSDAMVEYAARHAGARGSCRFEVGTAQQLDLPDASFDVVTSTFVMHHIPAEHRRAALGHMFRVLRPGGRLLIADMYPTGAVLPALVRVLARAGRAHGMHAMEELDVRRYADPIRQTGFVDLAFAVVRPRTGYLTASKPR